MSHISCGSCMSLIKRGDGAPVQCEVCKKLVHSRGCTNISDEGEKVCKSCGKGGRVIPVVDHSYYQYHYDRKPEKLKSWGQVPENVVGKYIISLSDSYDYHFVNKLFDTKEACIEYLGRESFMLAEGQYLFELDDTVAKIRKVVHEVLDGDKINY